MSADFVHLHSHSTHSYNDGFGNPTQIVESAKAKGFDAMALTDHGCLDGLISFYFEAKKKELKPILGVEAYICNDIRVRDSSGVNATKHITLLAKNARGYTSLCRLMTLAHHEGFYYKPRIDFSALEREGEGLIVLSGCGRSPVFDDQTLLRRLQKRFKDDFYFELIPTPEPSDYSGKASFLFERARRLGIKAVITGNCHYPSQEDHDIQDITLAIKSDSQYDDPDRPRMPRCLWQRTREELKAHAAQFLPWLSAKDFDAAADQTLAIARKIDIELEMGIPVKFNCGRLTANQLLRIRVKEGIERRGMAMPENYKERLDYELKLVESKGFADYFLIVADVIAWAKSKGILVGPARGSSAGSLACYILGITEIDPMPFGLLFERFIDANRIDIPDIDIDFEDRARGEVIEYLKRKYSHVGVLSAWSKWGAKSCLLDVARVFGIPQYEVRKITPLVIQRSGGDARASFTLADTFAEFPVAQAVMDQYPDLANASKLEAQVRQKTRHAAGIIISAKPIDKFASVYQDDCLSIGGGEAKDLGAMKLDVLGINTLTVIAEALKMIKDRTGQDIDIYNVPLEDPNVLAGFRERRLAGIFQYEGGAMKSVNRRIPARCFGDLALINAASRPGPLHCGGTAAYIARLEGKEPISFLSPLLEPILGHTKGIPMYQEQVLKVMREIGDLPWTKVGIAQKIMSRRTGVEALNKLFEEFKIGAAKKGIATDIAEKIWHDIQTFGSWAFNQSHAVSYSVLAYWTMYLKIYFPAEFYCASIAYTSSEEREIELTKEFKKIGGRILQVDPARSLAHPTLIGDDILMGWRNVAGIGEKLAENLEKGAPYKSSADMISRVKINKNQQRLLEDLGIIRRVQLDMFKTDTTPLDKRLLMKHCPWLFDMDLSPYRDLRCRMIDTLEATDHKQEITLVGVIRSIGLRDLNEINGMRGREGFKRATGGNTKFANIVVEDENDGILVTFSRKNYPQFADRIWKDGGIGNIIKVSGVIMEDMRKVYGNALQIVGKVGAVK